MGNKITRSKYRKKYERFQEYTNQYGGGQVNETTVCNFFHNMLENKELSVGSVWQMYSAINANTKVKCNVNLNVYKTLRSMLKNITKYYVLEKADILSFSQIKLLLTDLLDMRNDKQLQAIVSISLQYFGLLRNTECRMVEIKDVLILEGGGIAVDFAHATKSRARGFAFIAPPWLNLAFTKYIAQLQPKPGPDASIQERKKYGDLQFLRNVKSKKNPIRNQSMGRGMTVQHLRKVE